MRPRKASGGEPLISKSFRLTPTSADLLKRLALKYGQTQTDILERLIIEAGESELDRD